ncbi:1305_t:CDS:1, partial [Entrophospora sp. SA101]
LEKDDAVNNELLLHETSNEENEEDDDNDEYEVNENDKISLDFRNALESIKTW